MLILLTRNINPLDFLSVRTFITIPYSQFVNRKLKYSKPESRHISETNFHDKVCVVTGAGLGKKYVYKEIRLTNSFGF